MGNFFKNIIDPVDMMVCEILTKIYVHTVPMKSSSTLSSLFGIGATIIHLCIETKMASSFGRGSFHCRPHAGSQKLQVTDTRNAPA